MWHSRLDSVAVSGGTQATARALKDCMAWSDHAPVRTSIARPGQQLLKAPAAKITHTGWTPAGKAAADTYKRLVVHAMGVTSDAGKHEGIIKKYHGNGRKRRPATRKLAKAPRRREEKRKKELLQQTPLLAGLVARKR